MIEKEREFLFYFFFFKHMYFKFTLEETLEPFPIYLVLLAIHVENPLSRSFVRLKCLRVRKPLSLTA